MEAQTGSTLRPASPQLSPITPTSARPGLPAQAVPGPHLNALKHGLRSGSVLLPGDNVAAFRTLRRRLFDQHQPRTVEEAQCVETIAAAHWRIARCRLEQAHFKHHLGAVLSGHPDTAASLGDPDPHRLHHRGTDCLLEEQRLERSKLRAHHLLCLLQKQRTQLLPAGCRAALEDAATFLAEGDPAPEADLASAAATAPVHNDDSATEAVPTDTAALSGTVPTPSLHEEIGKIHKREPAGATRRFPKHWSRRQRQAAARRGSALPGQE